MKNKKMNFEFRTEAIPQHCLFRFAIRMKNIRHGSFRIANPEERNIPGLSAGICQPLAKGHHSINSIS